MNVERDEPSWSRGFYEWLVRTRTRDPARRVDGRLLAVAIVVVLVLVAVSVPLLLSQAVRPQVRLAIIVPGAFGSLALLVAYGINRRGHVELAGHAFVMSVVVFSAVYLGFNPAGGFTGNAWMLIPVIVAAFFLGPAWTAVYGTLVLVALAWGVSVSGTILQLEQTIVGMLLPGLLILLLARGRDMDRDQMLASTERLLLQQAQMDTVFRATPDAVFLCDTEGRIRLANKPASRLAESIGQRGDLENRSLIEVLPPSLAHPVHAQLPRVQGGGRYLDEIRMGGEAGIETCQVVMAPVPGDGIRGVLLDIRDTTRLREKELEAAAELEEAKQAILNMAAHELNTPMTPILIELQTLEARLGTDNSNMAAIGRIRRNLDRLSDSIEQMVDLALAREGSLPLSLEPVLFGDVADEAARRLHASFHAKKLHVQMDGGTGPTIYMDRSRVRRAIMNLLENAIEHSPSGGTVYLSWYDLPRGQVICKVRDEGVGFAADAESELFESFHALRDPRAPGGGKPGLGLALTKAIIEAHGGIVGASSEGPGHGAQFSFILPVDVRRQGMGRAGPSRREPPPWRSGRWPRTGPRPVAGRRKPLPAATEDIR